jgi:hypothetical protein
MRNIKRFLPAIVAGSLGSIGMAAANAAVDISAGVTSAQTDGLSMVGELAAFGAAVFLIFKVLRKLGLV